MKRLVFLLCMFFATAVARAETYYFDVARKGTSVGNGIISVDATETGYRVRYRMHIVVRVLRIPVYRLDSQQIAEFDKERRLISARTKADIDGTRHDVAVKRVGEKFAVVHNGSTKTIPQRDIIATTLNPIFGVPQSGSWLDLTDGNIVQYKVNAKGTKGQVFELIRPDGRDVLRLDENGIIDRVESFVSRGSLLMTRIESSKKPPVSLPDILQSPGE